MIQKVIRIGNSLGVTLPRNFVVKNKVKEGAKIAVSHSNGNITYSSKIPKSTEYQTVSDSDFFKIAKKVDSKYKEALDELANLP